MEEVSSKNTLKWYKLERMVQDGEVFRVCAGSAGLLENMKRCKMIID